MVLFIWFIYIYELYVIISPSQHSLEKEGAKHKIENVSNIHSHIAEINATPHISGTIN